MHQINRQALSTTIFSRLAASRCTRAPGIAQLSV
jgi:hypothetical protein